MRTGAFPWSGWIGAAVLIGLLFVLLASLRQSADAVDAHRRDLAAMRGGMRKLLLALVGLAVFMAFQNLVLVVVLMHSLWERIFSTAGGGMLFARYVLPAAASLLFYCAAIALLVWARKPWVPAAASACLWIAGPAVSIPAYALFGAQPGLADFAFPSLVAAAGTAYLLLGRRPRTLYRLPGGNSHG